MKDKPLKIHESLIGEYAKRIYGFAFSKTGDAYEAEDLSQEIALALCGIDFPEKQIDNMDAYIYRVCRYTWAKYLRRNRPRRECLPGEYVECAGDDFRLEEDVIESELCEKLRREIMYLGRTRREATILFWYDNKSGEEISKLLGIPAATVRWHLHRAKNELKERIEMKQDTIYRPVRLSIGHYGWQDNDVMRQLESDALMQNICRVCFDSELTAEDISRTLGVAGFYLEDKLDKLCSMEYVTKSPKGRYRTNFFIRNAEYQLAHSRYQYEKTLPLAEGYYRVVKAALPEIKASGLDGPGDDILLWDLLLYFMMGEIGRTDERMIALLGLEHGAPIRPDGTRHWVRAALSSDEVLKAQTGEDAGFGEFFRAANGFGLKSGNITPANVRGVQFDSPFVSDWRHFGQKEILALRRLRETADGGMSELDRDAVAGLIEKGYASRDGESIRVFVPYFSREQKAAADGILAKYADALLDRDADLKLFTGYAEHMKRLIPACVCENERNHYLTSYDPYNAIFWLLCKNGYLRAPDAAERGYICTLMWDS